MKWWKNHGTKLNTPLIFIHIILQVLKLQSNGFWLELDKLQHADLPSLIARTRKLVMCSKAASTNLKYAAAFARWECLATLHTTDVTLSANPLHVRLYLAHLAGLASSPSVLDAAYYGIKWAHKLCGLPDPTCHSLPTIVMDSARRVLGKPAVAKNP